MANIGKTYRRFGIDPVSRGAGIEPEGWAGAVTGALGFPEEPGIIPPPQAKPVPPMPQPDDEARRTARRRSLLQQRRRSGRASTILSDDTVGDTLG